MAVLRCKMCGGNLLIEADMSICECEFCGTKQTVPKVDDEKKVKLFDRANRLRINCEFDKWLNETFYYAAFGTYHQQIIVSSTVTADGNPIFNTNPGNSTTDWVFLLSITQANMYFFSDSERQCQGTAYCYSQGAVKLDRDFFWWLRSPGALAGYAAFVRSDGYVNSFGCDVGTLCGHDGNGVVRPALWIKLEA